MSNKGYCSVCGAPMVEYKTGEVAYSISTGQVGWETWASICSRERGLWPAVKKWLGFPYGHDFRRWQRQVPQEVLE